MYVFIRQDLPLEIQLVQSNHATFQLAALSGPYEDGIPNLIVIGVPNVRTLLRTANKLRAAQIPHYEYREPDIPADNRDANFTAITTAPLDDEQRKVLENYRLYRYAPAVSCETPDSKSGEVGSTPARRANARVAATQPKGESPTAGSLLVLE